MRRLATSLTIVTILLSTRSLAAWNPDPNVCLAICTDPSDQDAPAVLADDNKGAFVAWMDHRAGNGIYMQHLDKDGNPLWATNGIVAVSGATGDEIVMVPDGTNGFFLLWMDARSTGGSVVYGQRVNGSGVPQWVSTGVALTGTGTSINRVIRNGLHAVADGTGGAIACWEQHNVDRFGTETPITARAQRTDGIGTRVWGTSGITLSSGTGGQGNPDLAADGSGGAIITWDEARSGLMHVYAQRVNSAGLPLWSTNGNSVEVNAMDPSVISDGSGGVIVAFTSTANDIWAHRMDANGGHPWSISKLVCNASGTQNYPVLVTDAAGGAVIAWNDLRSGIVNLYAQRLNAAGNPQWTANGVNVAYTPSAYGPASMVSNTIGGAALAWTDYRINQSYDIRGACVDNTGSTWTIANSAVCTTGDTQNMQAMAPDGRGGGIIVWKDWRTGRADIYAQRIEPYGYIADPSPRITSVEDIPADQGGWVKVSWTASYVDNEFAPGTFTYSVYRRLSPTQFEFMGTQPLGPQAQYSMLVPTLADSGAANPFTAYRVEARVALGPMPHWYSSVDSGYSVDNVVPNGPSGLTGSYINGVTSLEWVPDTDVDLAAYRVYRGTFAEFAIAPASRIAEVRTPGYIDAAGAPYAYRVTAVDRNGNESLAIAWVPSGGLGPADAGGVTRLDAPRPNPALMSATLQFVLARPSTVHLTVCDIAGRLVRELSAEHMEPGEHRVAWDLRNAAGGRVAPGTYFVRLKTDGQPLLTRPLVVVR